MRGQKLSKYSLKEALGEIKVQMGETCSLLDLSLSLSFSLFLEGNEVKWKPKDLKCLINCRLFLRAFERGVRTLGKNFFSSAQDVRTPRSNVRQKHGAFERVTEAFERQAKFSKNPIFLPSGRSNGAFERQAKNSGRSNV